MLSIGLMSGTSMDGIDAALIFTDGVVGNIKELGHSSLAYPNEFKLLLKAAEYSVRKFQGNMVLAQEYYPQAVEDFLKHQLNLSNDLLLTKKKALNRYLIQHGLACTLPAIIELSTDLHTQVVQNLLAATQHAPEQIAVAGYHGQTFFHQPKIKKSIIVGDAQRLANSLHITVVNDFRSQDIAAGGQGAPLAPLYHQALAVRDQILPVAIVNCGGVANVSLIFGKNHSEMLAFDTGPGNGLIDQWVRKKTQGSEHMDYNGKYGKVGKINEPVLAALYQASTRQQGQNYFSMAPPKSLDAGDFQLIPEIESLSLEDGCATLEAFTADTIITGLQRLNLNLPQRWILAGGGWHNPVILSELQSRLSAILKADPIIQTADQAGWNSQAMEAQIFAFLAVRSIQKLPISFPNTTGVANPLTGGSIFAPNLLQ
ncbi:MAG: anhydro-N-acetylmuramic acid kinase [Proteobacteria bacterium]|nr:anhydro-N-acetylmuramic acid kinase [Pseudomonadota bacterium]